MASLGFEITAENKELLKKFQESEKAAQQYASEMVGLGDVIDREYRRSIQSASGNINELSNEITKQKQIISETEADIKRYTTELANFNPLSTISKAEIEDNLLAAKKALNEQKFSLSDLKNQQEVSKNTLKSLNDEYKIFKNELKEAQTIEVQSGNSLKRLAESANDLSGNMSNIPGPVGQAASGIQAMTRAAMAFIATPLGMILAAIAAGLALVSSWFTRTEEGQHALNVASKTFGQVLNSILDIASDVGEWLYKAFTSPKEAIRQLGQFIDSQINNRLTGLAKMSDAIVKIFQSNFKVGWGDLGNAFTQTITGIEDAGNKVVGFYDDAKKKALEANDLAKRENVLSVQNRDFLVERERLQSRINKLREEAYDAETTDSDKQKKLNEAKKLTNQLYSKEIELAKENYEIIKQQNSLSHSNSQDKQKEAEALAQVIRLEGQRANALKSILRESNKYNKNTSLEDQKRIAQELIKLQEDNIEDGIYLMEEGHDKRMKQIDHDYNKEIMKLEEKISKWREAQGGALTKEQTTAYDKSYENALKKRLRSEEKELLERNEAEKKSWIEYNKAYGNYQAKRLAITEEYIDKIAKAQTGGEKASLEKQQEEALSKLDRSMVEQSDLWIRLFEDAEKHTSKYIQSTINELQQLIDYVKGVEGSTIPTGWTEESVKAMFKDTQDIEVAMNRLIKLRDELNQRNPFSQIIKGFKDLKSAGSDTEKQFEGFQNVSQGMNGVSSAVNMIAGALQDVGVEADSTAGKITKVVSQTASWAATGAQVGGLWGGIIGAVIGLGTSLVSVLAGGHKVSQKTIDQYNNLIKVMDDVISKQKELISSMYGQDAIEQSQKSLELLRKQEEAARNLFKETMDERSFNAHSTGYRIAKILEPFRNELEELGFDYENLSKNRAKGLADLSAHELLVLKTEIPELWAKIGENERQYLEQIIETGEKTKELGEATAEALTGLSFNSLKDSLDDIITQVDLSFEDVADSFEDHMSKSIKNIVKKGFLDKELADWYKNYEAAMDNGSLSPDDIEQLRKQYEYAAEEGNRRFKEMMDIAGIDISKESERTSAAKGISSMTQDTASEINANFFGLRQSVNEIKEHIKEKDINNMAIGSYAESIAVNTQRSIQLFQDQLQVQTQIERNTFNTTRVLTEMNTQGVKIRE